MKNARSLLALGAILAVIPLAAQARPIHHAKADLAPSAKSKRAATEGFAARMHRLDALMGTEPASRTRSASAER